MTLRALGCVLLALVVAGCGGSDGDEPRKTGEKGDFAVYEVAGSGFEIGLPRSWKAISGDELFDEASVDEFRKDNPDLAPFVEVLAQPDSPVKLFAADPELRQGFATNVNVVAHDAPADLDLETWMRAELASVRRHAVGDVQSETVTLPAGKAMKLDYSLDLDYGDDTRTISTLQYGLLARSRAYVITLSTLPDAESEYTETFAAIAESFRVTG